MVGWSAREDEASIYFWRRYVFSLSCIFVEMVSQWGQSFHSSPTNSKSRRKTGRTHLWLVSFSDDSNSPPISKICLASMSLLNCPLFRNPICLSPFFLFESAGGKYRPQFFCLCLSLSLSCFVSSVLLVFFIFICLEFFRFARVLSDPPLPCCRHYHHHQSSNRFRSLFVLTLLVLCYSTSSMASGFANRLVVSGSGPSILARVLFIRSVVFEQSVGSYTNQHTMVRPYRPNPSAIAGGDKVGHTN